MEFVNNKKNTECHQTDPLFGEVIRGGYYFDDCPHKQAFWDPVTTFTETGVKPMIISWIMMSLTLLLQYAHLFMFYLEPSFSVMHIHTWGLSNLSTVSAVGHGAAPLE